MNKAIKVEAIRTKHIIAHDTIVEHTGNPSLNEWQEFGLKLMAAEKYTQWYLGWWWHHGHKKWSREAEAFVDECGYKRETLKVYGSIYNSVKPLMRINSLSFNHHQIVAPLPSAEQEEWLKICTPKGKKKWTVAKLRKAIREAHPIPSPPLPKGVFDLVCADPPWRYEFAPTKASKIENHYPTMATEEIISIVGLRSRFADNSCLYLWATNPKLKQAIEVLEGWGFRYVSNMVWVKDKIGMGYWARGRHELLLIGVKGKYAPPVESARPDSVVEANRTAHSAKPDEVYETLRRIHPKARPLELFARKKRPGWECWGNEVEGGLA